MSGQASSASMTPSPSLSGGGGQPCFFGSSFAGPASSGHASTSSVMPSLSRSPGGGQPCFFGSSFATPGTSGHASTAIEDAVLVAIRGRRAAVLLRIRVAGRPARPGRRPPRRRSRPCRGPVRARSPRASTRASRRRGNPGVPMPEVKPGPAATPSSKSSERGREAVAQAEQHLDVRVAGLRVLEHRRHGRLGADLELLLRAQQQADARAAVEHQALPHLRERLRGAADRRRPRPTRRSPGSGRRPGSEAGRGPSPSPTNEPSRSPVGTHT